MKKVKIIIATRNKGKVREMANAFSALPVELISLADWEADLGLTEHPEPVEDGETFEENSFKKADFYAKLTGLPCIADDSGLEVEALGGAPGVYSARYSGENATDEKNNAKLLADIKAKGLNESPAAYQCALTFMNTDGGFIKEKGYCHGTIKCTEPKGENGFGYDPYFYVDWQGESKTMAELTVEEKHTLSHRGAALDKMAVSLGKIMMFLMRRKPKCVSV